MSVVPTFRPTESLKTLVARLTQDGPVIVSDDGSPCTADALLLSVKASSNVTVIRHHQNAGIARGLNDGLAAAKDGGVSWLLTVDQDTDLPFNYVKTLVSTANRLQMSGVSIGAIGAETIEDLSGVMTYPSRVVDGLLITEELIQTGTLWSVPALLKCGGFNESLGIDAVDAAACLKLRELGYAICIAPGTSIRHEIGAAKTIHVFGRKVMVTGHSAERRTSIVRNRLRLFPHEFAQSPRHAFRTLRRVAVNQSLGLIVESDRWAKAKGTIRGLRPPKDG